MTPSWRCHRCSHHSRRHDCCSHSCDSNRCRSHRYARLAAPGLAARREVPGATASRTQITRRHQAPSSTCRHDRSSRAVRRGHPAHTQPCSVRTAVRRTARHRCWRANVPINPPPTHPLQPRHRTLPALPHFSCSPTAISTPTPTPTPTSTPTSDHLTHLKHHTHNHLNHTPAPTRTPRRPPHSNVAPLTSSPH